MVIISTSIIELLLSQKQCIITITYITFLVTISIAIALLFLVNYHALLASKTKVNVFWNFFFFSKWASSSEMECQQQRKEKNSKNSYLIVLFFQFYSTEGHTKVDKLYVGSCLEFLLGIKTLFYTDREIVLQSFFIHKYTWIYFFKKFN